jgi:protein-tyrosine kinase
MSLIEQAAKRLEELRRSGADLGDAKPTGGTGGQFQGGDPPTPEAVVRALDARAAHARATDSAAAEAVAVHAVPSSPARPEGKHEFVAEPPSIAAVPPVLAPLPQARRTELDLNRLAARGFVTPNAPKSQLADEFRVIKRPIIRNALARDASGKNRNLVMVTSALPAEGKTFTAVNLAMSVAMEYDHTVLLIDGDVAHPTLPSLLGVPSEPGLLDLLTRDDIDVSDALVRTNVDKLTVLPAGSRHRRATELLASEQMANLLHELALRYSDRIIIFDSPPLLATTEARVLASLMGQIIMVVAADTTTQNTVNQALATIESCEIVMMMLNKARQTEVGSYYGYYTDDVAR